MLCGFQRQMAHRMRGIAARLGPELVDPGFRQDDRRLLQGFIRHEIFLQLESGNALARQRRL